MVSSTKVNFLRVLIGAILLCIAASWASLARR
jgi:hypothetical protein